MSETTPPSLVKTKYGFYQYAQLPSDEELCRYYESKYYQEGRGSYNPTYLDEEILYFRNKARLLYNKASSLLDMGTTRLFLDIGCGEGWVLNEFRERGHDVRGLDFSRYGIEKFHGHLLNCFDQGNIYDLMQDNIGAGRKYDIILLANVMEHVKDPEGLLLRVKQLMFPHTLLIIVTPNDFSRLHEFLQEQKKISRQFWLCYPDHLSYFNKESMTRFVEAFGLAVRSVVADNPIDLNLLNDNSNYIEDPSRGKNTHLFRVMSDNFIAGISTDKLLQIYELLGSMGIGRDLSYYCTLAQ